LSEFLVIVNPAAGRGRARRQWPDLARRLAAGGIAFDQAMTSRSLEASEVSEKEANN